jgi:hypothetical protein
VHLFLLEVGEDGRICDAKHDVVGLDVSVTDLAFIVQVLQGQEQVFQHEAQARGWEPPGRTETDGSLDTLPQRRMRED